MTLEPPDFRALVRRDTVRISDWRPWLATGGPMAQLARTRGSRTTAIVDLTVDWFVDEDGDRTAEEVVVTPIAGDVDRARGPLLRWASTVGYRRVWLPGDVVDLPVSPGGAASVTCPGCGMRWEDRGDAHFWLTVRARGRFPNLCVVCGTDTPQWTVSPPAERAIALEDRHRAPMDVR